MKNQIRKPEFKTIFLVCRRSWKNIIKSKKALNQAVQTIDLKLFAYSKSSVEPHQNGSMTFEVQFNYKR